MKVEIKKGIYWVGAVDWNMRTFHGDTYATETGTTYNAYLIVDEKIALVDTVYGPFAKELLARIKEIIPPEKIDYIISNHVEIDHSGSMPEVMSLVPRAKLFGTQKCKEGLYRHYYQNWDFEVVKTGDKLRLGKRTLVFVEAPMLHWPDSMFTYCPEEELLMPNDAFGQHYASSERFDDEVDAYVLMEEAAKYYANILWPLSGLILKKIEDIQKMNIPIKMIAPSHGIIWRRDPMKIMNAYTMWAKNESAKRVVIVYETMWGATDKMARAIAEGVKDAGIPVKLFNVVTSEQTTVIREMMDAKGYIIGSSTHDNGMLPTIAGFLEFLSGLKPRNRVAGLFGSYGWGGGAVKSMEEVVQKAGITLTAPSIACRYVPDEGEIRKCYEYGLEFGRKL